MTTSKDRFVEWANKYKEAAIAKHEMNQSLESVAAGSASEAEENNLSAHKAKLPATTSKIRFPCAYCNLEKCHGGCIPEYKHRLAEVERDRDRWVARNGNLERRLARVAEALSPANDHPGRF